MNDSLYEVIFCGQIHQDADMNAVKANIGKMFKADEVTIARLFSGKRVVIKKNLSAEAADKYSMAFARAGAICELELMPDDGTSPAPAEGTSSAGSKTATNVATPAKWDGRKIAVISAVAAVLVAVTIVAALYFTSYFAN